MTREQMIHMAECDHATTEMLTAVAVQLRADGETLASFGRDLATIIGIKAKLETAAGHAALAEARESAK